MTSSGDPQSFNMCILDASIVGVAYVWTPNRCSLVGDRSSHQLVRHMSRVSFCCPQDVHANALRMLVSAGYQLCYIVVVLVER